MDKRLVEIGRRWVEKHLYSMELFHHGIKGQKWGIRNGPPYPLDKSKKNGIIEEAIRSGKVTTSINREKQLRHTKSHHLEGRSYLNGDLEYAQELINKLSGTGKALINKRGEWTGRERVSSENAIGMVVDPDTKKETPTKAAMIMRGVISNRRKQGRHGHLCSNLYRLWWRNHRGCEKGSCKNNQSHDAS